MWTAHRGNADQVGDSKNLEGSSSFDLLLQTRCPIRSTSLYTSLLGPFGMAVGSGLDSLAVSVLGAGWFCFAFIHGLSCCLLLPCHFLDTLFSWLWTSRVEQLSAGVRHSHWSTRYATFGGAHSSPILASQVHDLLSRCTVDRITIAAPATVQGSWTPSSLSSRPCADIHTTLWTFPSKIHACAFNILAGLGGSSNA